MDKFSLLVPNPEEVTSKKAYPARKIFGGLVGLAAVGAASVCAFSGAPDLVLVTNLDRPLVKERMVEKGKWGTWKGWKRESSPWVACGMRVRYEEMGSGDRSAINGIEFRYCDEDDWWGTQKDVEIWGGLWGTWDDDFTMCNKDAYITSMKARFNSDGRELEDDKQDYDTLTDQEKSDYRYERGDITALSGIQIRCRQKNWVIDHEPVVAEGDFYGRWKDWSSEQNFGMYYVTGAQMRFEDHIWGDDSAGNGLQIETQEKFKEKNVITPGWRQLKSKSGDIEMTIKTTITDSKGKTIGNMKEQHMDASVSVNYEVSSGIHTGGGEIALSAGSKSEVKKSWTDSFSVKYESTDTTNCKAKEGKYTKLYVFELDLVTADKPTMKIQTDHYVCCYDDQVPKCHPSKCMGEACQTCAE